MSEERPQAPDTTGVESAPTFYDFTQNTTFHGVKYIFEGNTKLRKFLWLIAVLAASGVFIWQVGQRTYDYYQYHTNVDVQIVYASEMPFPAVTLCNQNNFRTSVTVERGLYAFIDEIYSAQNVSEVDLSQYILDTVDTEEFLRATAHQISDFIDSCTWQGKPCNITEDFVTTLTDLGVCYTFNSGQKKDPIMVKEAGSAFGLVLILNVEQYEYMRGPQNDAGIKLMLHNQKESPLVKEQGFAVAPGSHTLAGIDRTVTHNMEPPYGDCNATDTVPLANCLIDCRRQFVSERCGCMDIYMKNLSQSTVGVCDMRNQFVCIREQTMEAMRQQSSCECKQACEYEQYVPSLSYAQLSKFNIDRIVLNDAVRRTLVLEKFLLARELSQRRVQELAEADKTKLLEIRHLVDVLWDAISVADRTLKEDNQFADYHYMVALLETGDQLLREDAYTFNHNVETWKPTLAALKGHYFMYVPRYLDAVLTTFLEMDENADTGTGLTDKIQRCMVNPFLFPLPDDYDDVHEFFKDHTRRKKRSHVSEAPTSSDFYLVDVPVYKKLHTVDDCGHYLALKQEFAKDLVARHLDLDVDRQHATFLYDGIHSVFHEIFHNSSKSPEAFPKYQPCIDYLEFLKLGLFEDIDKLVEGVRLFALADTWQSMGVALSYLANELESADFTVESFEDKCMWPYTDYMGPGGSDYDIVQSLRFDCEASYSYFPSARVSFSNLGDYAHQIYTIMQDEVLPKIKVVDEYLAGQSTKLHLAKALNSLELERSLQVMEAVSADFVSFGREFDQGMKSITFHVSKCLQYAFGTSFPLVNNEGFWNMALIKHFHASGVPAYMDILNTYYDGAHLGDIAVNLVEQTRIDYSKAIAELKISLPTKIEEMVKAITLMKTQLEEYVEDNKMNQAFFMENFAQIDIFYKSMSYTEITVQNAFPFISLLSEFGGFMGLLLGASCLTLIEILDHLLSLACSKLKTTSRSRDVTRVESGPQVVKTGAWM